MDLTYYLLTYNLLTYNYLIYHFNLLSKPTSMERVLR